MSFVQREIQRLHDAMQHQHGGDHIADRLHAALEALLWVEEPLGTTSPTDLILGRRPTQEVSLVIDSATSPRGASGSELLHPCVDGDSAVVADVDELT